MKLKLASRWPQLTVLIRESFNHTFDWFIQTKQATVFMNESLNHLLAWFIQWGPHLIRQWLVTGHIYAAFKYRSDEGVSDVKLTWFRIYLHAFLPWNVSSEGSIFQFSDTTKTSNCLYEGVTESLAHSSHSNGSFDQKRSKQLSLWRSHWIIGSLESFKHLIRSETKQATVLMKESLNHWLAQVIQTAHSIRNEASDCSYEGVTESLAHSIHSNGSFDQKRSKQLSLWRSHWIIGSLDSFKRLIRSEMKQATVLMKESLNHYLSQYVQTADSFRNEESDCLYE